MAETEISMSNDFAKIVLQRKSVRAFQPDVKITHAEMLEMIDEAVKAPTGFNMEPWSFEVVETQEGKDKILNADDENRPQITSSSALVVICGNLHMDANAAKVLDRSVKSGLMPEAVYTKQKKLIEGYLPGLESDRTRLVQSLTLDAALVSMQFMLIAREHGYDTCAMTGFDHDAFVKDFYLGKDEKLPILMIAIGKAAKPGFSSYRLPAKEITEFH